MRSLKVLFVILCAVCAVNTAHAQDSSKMAKVYFVRSTGVTGLLLTYHCFIDSSLVCGLKNNQYSEHFIAPGKHQLDVAAHSKKYTNSKLSLTITAVAGQSYYIKAMPVKGYDNKVKLISMSENTIRPLLNKCEPKTDCLQ